MVRTWVRLLLVFTGLAAIAAAGTLIWFSELHTRNATDSFRLAEDQGRHLLAGAADLRAAQQSYVAVGQGEDFWLARVSALAKDLDEVLSVFRRHLSSGEALAAADEAIGTLRDFGAVDLRAREYVRAHQLTQASDVIFGDGFDVTHRLSDAITRAMTAEAVAHDAIVAERRRNEAIALGAAGGVEALMLLLLIPGARRKEPAAVAAPPAPVAKQLVAEPDDLDVMVRAAAPVSAPVAVPVPPPPDPVDLNAVAAICADLARVTDTRAITGLLARVASVLDAAGIVVWIADPDGRELAPIVVHGYPPQMATRLGTIARDAANVTASAYRTGLLQTVKGDAVSNGAIAVPLITVTGCLGVMAAEMTNGGEQREPLLAAATIIASQLSTLVGPPSARSRAEAAS
jgi:hypothetical protein